MNNFEKAAVVFLCSVGTTLILFSVWGFNGHLETTMRVLMFLLGISTNAPAVIFAVWKLKLFESKAPTQ